MTYSLGIARHKADKLLKIKVYMQQPRGLPTTAQPIRKEEGSNNGLLYKSISLS